MYARMSHAITASLELSLMSADQVPHVSSAGTPSSPRSPLAPIRCGENASLPSAVEECLTFDVNELIQNLMPSQTSREKRVLFLNKIQSIIDKEWPGKEIKAHLFGSSTNGLGTPNSDVDICLTTPWVDYVKGIQNMDIIADCLRKNGMVRIRTIPEAKVPICKFFDPQFFLSCDINVNNAIALRNTELIKRYVDMDPRARSLIMLVKHWTKKRVLNDAGKGGTLSSYCWVMMVINFLQIRSPPILPSLHVLYQQQLENNPESIHPTIVQDVDCSFYDIPDEKLRVFGSANHETLGALLYTFFHYYGYDFDYENSVVSVRSGCVLSKKDKGWNTDVDRMCRFLCVEEPFNTRRNLGNSADYYSVAGLRYELQRAENILAMCGDFDEVCQEYNGYFNTTFPGTHHQYYHPHYHFTGRHHSRGRYNSSSANKPRFYHPMPRYPISSSSVADTDEVLQPLHQDHIDSDGRSLSPTSSPISSPLSQQSLARNHTRSPHQVVYYNTYIPSNPLPSNNNSSPPTPTPVIKPSPPTYAQTVSSNYVWAKPVGGINSVHVEEGKKTSGIKSCRSTDELIPKPKPSESSHRRTRSGYMWTNQEERSFATSKGIEFGDFSHCAVDKTGASLS